jgi:hypothetical protein
VERQRLRHLARLERRASRPRATARPL